MRKIRQSRCDVDVAKKMDQIPNTGCVFHQFINAILKKRTILRLKKFFLQEKPLCIVYSVYHSAEVT